MKAQGPSPHSEDALHAAAIASATSFSAYLFNGVFDKFCTRDLPDARSAFAEAERLEREHSTSGRRALVYAVTGQGFTVLCTEALARQAGVL